MLRSLGCDLKEMSLMVSDLLSSDKKIPLKLNI